MTLHSFSQNKSQLIYIGDPMCSWCYGFAPEITKLQNEFEDQLDFKLIVGGLRPYGTETMASLGDFLKHHWEDVYNRSGQPFSYDIIQDTTFIYDTEPACRAVVTVREMNPSIELAFFKDIQTAFYVENKNTNNIDTYITLVKKHKLNETEFATLFNSEEMKKATLADFQLSSQLGATGFPATIIMHEGKTYTIARGYAKAEDIREQILKIIN
jgi:putative protein-disulfide isomerase